MATFKREFKTNMLRSLADTFKEDTAGNYFMFIARPEAWSDEESPTTFINSINSYYDVWNRMIAAKRITDADIYLMAPRNTWTSGTVYDEYTDDVDLHSSTDTKTYYVTNSELNVYKCIHNNSNATSTVSPTGAPDEVFTTSDGYKWRFLFRVPSSTHRIMTDDLIPIRSLKVDEDVADKYDDDRYLSYRAQYNAVHGSIENIKVNNAGDSYGRSIIADEDSTKISTSTTTVVSFANTATMSSDDNHYNGYTLRIVSGTGVGQIRGLTGYDGTDKTATVTPAWGTPPDSTSVYEIMPEIGIDGNGSDAVATPRLNSDKTIDSVTILEKGKDYTRATAIVTTSNGANGATLTPMLSPYGGHADNPEMELKPSKAMIMVRLEGQEGATTDFDIPIPAANDYRQYGIIKNPVINTGYSGAGRIAGDEVDTFTDVKVKADTGTFNSDSYESGDVVFGKTSQVCGEVVSWGRSTDFSKGVIKLKNVGGDFASGETVINVTNTGSNVYSSAGNKIATVEFQDETQSSRATNNYRLATKLIVGPTGSGYSSKTFTDENWTEDMVVTGGSGSNATLITFTNTGVAGGTAEVLLTSINGVSTAGPYGFTAGENLVLPASSPITPIINTIEPPHFVVGSGELIHIENVTKVERHPEQEENLRITIDLS